MSKSKHTQGKWEVSTGDPDKRNYGVYSIEGGRIAEVLSQNSANARLIAAAPALLEAAKKTINSHFRESYLTCPEDCWCWDLDTAIELAEEVKNE